MISIVSKRFLTIMHGVGFRPIRFPDFQHFRPTGFKEAHKNSTSRFLLKSALRGIVNLGQMERNRVLSPEQLRNFSCTGRKLDGVVFIDPVCQTLLNLTMLASEFII